MFNMLICDFDSKALNCFLDSSSKVHVSQSYKIVDGIKEL